MTYSLTVNGSMNNLENEASIEAKARELVSSLSEDGGVMSAMLTTTYGGSVNLMVPGTALVEDVNSGDPGDEQPE